MLSMAAAAHGIGHLFASKITSSQKKLRTLRAFGWHAPDGMNDDFGRCSIAWDLPHFGRGVLRRKAGWIGYTSTRSNPRIVPNGRILCRC